MKKIVGSKTYRGEIKIPFAIECSDLHFAKRTLKKIHDDLLRLINTNHRVKGSHRVMAKRPSSSMMLERKLNLPPLRPEPPCRFLP